MSMKIPYLTVTKRKFDLWDVKPKDICVFDFAHGCAKECRFGNQIEQHYSVAEHQIHVASLVEDEFKLYALLHDAAEGLGLRDMSSPIKHWDGMIGYRLLEDRVQSAILGAFNLHRPPDEMAAIMKVVKSADKLMYHVENRDLRERLASDVGWVAGVEGHKIKNIELFCWDAETARQKYIEVVAKPFFDKVRRIGFAIQLPPAFDNRTLQVLSLTSRTVKPEHLDQ